MIQTCDETKPSEGIQLNARSVGIAEGDAGVFWANESAMCRLGTRVTQARSIAELQNVLAHLTNATGAPAARLVQTAAGPELHWERVGKPTYSWEWPVAAWRVAAATALRALDALKARNLTLANFLPSDVFMAGPTPIVVGVHNLVDWSSKDETAAVETIERHFLRPFRCAVHGHARLARKLMRGGPNGLSADDEAVILGERQSVAQDVRGYIAWLEHTDVSLTPESGGWDNYESGVDDKHPDEVAAKGALVLSIVDRLRPASIVDIACNTGRYVLSAAPDATVVGMDGDEWCMNEFFIRAEKSGRLAAGVVTEMRDPSTSRGWGTGWSAPLEKRVSSELVMMLAFLHHLVLRSRISRTELRSLFESLASRWALVEVAPRAFREAVPTTSYTVDWVLDAIGGSFVKEEVWHYGQRGRCLVLLRRA